MKNLKSQLNKKVQFHLDCITELSTTDYDFVHGLSDSDHNQAVKTLIEVLTWIDILESTHCELCSGSAFTNSHRGCL